jgi:hypothetical protein
MGILRCDACGRPLGQVSRNRGSEYGCRWKGCTSRTSVDAAAIDRYVLGVLLPVCDSPAMRSIVTAEQGVSENEAQALVTANAADEAKVTKLADLLTDGSLDPTAYAHATKKLRAAIEQRQATLASLRSGTALDLLGGSVAESWDSLDQPDRAAILGQFVTSVRVRRSTTRRGRAHGGGAFDSGRVRFAWRYPALAKAAIGLWEAMTDEEKQAAQEQANREIEEADDAA